jgi:hypothetical protein
MKLFQLKQLFRRIPKTLFLHLRNLPLPDLKGIYTLESNEYLSNSLVKDNFSINVGSIDSVKRISNILDNVYISARICNSYIKPVSESKCVIRHSGQQIWSYDFKQYRKT